MDSSCSEKVHLDSRSRRGLIATGPHNIPYRPIVARRHPAPPGQAQRGDADTNWPDWAVRLDLTAWYVPATWHDGPIV